MEQFVCQCLSLHAQEVVLYQTSLSAGRGEGYRSTDKDSTKELEGEAERMKNKQDTS